MSMAHAYASFSSKEICLFFIYPECYDDSLSMRENFLGKLS